MKVVSESDLRVALLSGAVVLSEAGVEREVSDEIGSADYRWELSFYQAHLNQLWNRLKNLLKLG